MNEGIFFSINFMNEQCGSINAHTNTHIPLWDVFIIYGFQLNNPMSVSAEQQ